MWLDGAAMLSPLNVIIVCGIFGVLGALLIHWSDKPKAYRK